MRRRRFTSEAYPRTPFLPFSSFVSPACVPSVPDHRAHRCEVPAVPEPLYLTCDSVVSDVDSHRRQDEEQSLVRSYDSCGLCVDVRTVGVSSEGQIVDEAWSCARLRVDDGASGSIGVPYEPAPSPNPRIFRVFDDERVVVVVARWRERDALVVASEDDESCCAADERRRRRLNAARDVSDPDFSDDASESVPAVFDVCKSRARGERVDWDVSDAGCNDCDRFSCRCRAGEGIDG